MITHLRKLRGKSAAELRDRSRQYLLRKLESYQVSSVSYPDTSNSILETFGNGTSLTPDDLLERFRSGNWPSLLAAFRAPISAIVSSLNDRLPDDSAQIVERADRIIDGSFDMLGYCNLRFGGTTPDWHFDPVSGRTSPRVHWSRIIETDASDTGDKKVIWELNRHQYFTTLGQAYLLTGDEKYANTFAAHIQSWCENNPPKIGVNWLSSLEIAFRSISWIWAVHFFKDSPALSGELLLRIISNLHLNGRHLETYLSTYFSPNTHLTGEALGLYYLGSFLPELSEAKRWRRLGYKILMDMLDVHVMPDGVYCEQSSHYDRYTTDFYLNLLILRREQGKTVEPKHVEKLNLLLDHLVHLTQPDGMTPLFGDEDGGRFLSLDFAPVNDFRPTLALGAALLGRGDLKYVAGEATPELLWLLGPKGLADFDSLERVAPSRRIQGFAEGGIFCARTSWAHDADHVVVDCGPHGFLNGGHAHADALNMLLSINGRPLLVDSGTYSYTADLESRDRFRSTSAHNCLSVDGMASSVPAGPFSWGSTATATLLEWSEVGDGVVFRGSHDGFASIGVEYSREIQFTSRGETTVIERITSERLRAFELNFILAPELSTKTKANSIELWETGRRIATIETVWKTGEIQQEPTWKIDDWQISPKYGSLTPTKRLRLVFAGSGQLSITVLIRGEESVRQPTQRSFGL